MSEEKIPPTVEEMLQRWPGSTGEIPEMVRRFIEEMRRAADMGYGAMQQIIEWEWRRRLVTEWKTPADGALGPLCHERLIRQMEALEKENERLKKQLKGDG